MALHIDELTIHSLRGIHDLKLQQLGNVNLFVGDNNSGKTTVLEAVALFCRPLDPWEWLSVARGRVVKSSRESRLEGVRWLFPQDDAVVDDPYYKGQVRIDGRGEFPCLEAAARFAGFEVDEDESPSTSSGWDDEEDEEESDSSAFDEDEEQCSPTGTPVMRGAEITLSARVPPDGHCLLNEFELIEDERLARREPPREPRLEVVSITPFSHRVEQLQISQLSEATLTQRASNVLECVSLIDPRIRELEIISRRGVRSTLWVRHEATGYSPLYTLGDGVRRVLAMALGLIDAQNGVLLIDEIETAIHKDALVGVFQWLVREARHFNVQLFATTHSLEAVDAVLMAQMDEPDQLVAFHLPEHGKGQPKRFSGELLDNLRFDRGLDIR